MLLSSTELAGAGVRGVGLISGGGVRRVGRVGRWIAVRRVMRAPSSTRDHPSFPLETLKPTPMLHTQTS